MYSIYDIIEKKINEDTCDAVTTGNLKIKQNIFFNNINLLRMHMNMYMLKT